MYKPLQPGHIRLIRMLSNTDTDNEVGLLECFGLDEAPPFYALSHTWGAKKQDTTIRINGIMMQVSRHLATGLHCLKQFATIGSSLLPPLKYIWIDNICIDQGNRNERSSQVWLMGKIYSRAIRTLIWLGPVTDGSDTAWRLIDEINSLVEKQHPSITLPEQIPKQMFSEIYHASTGLPGFRSKAWQALWDLFQLAWFSRIWIVQEVVLSREDPLFIHGDFVFPWNRLERAASWLRRNGYLRMPCIPEGLLHIDCLGYLKRTKASWPLNALMSITQKKFRATDQRDKVYGLLGLAAELVDNSYITEALVPNYAIDVKQVYMNATRHSLERDGSLAILTRVRGTENSISRKRRQYDFGNWPSWLPDWSDFSVCDRELRKSLSWIHYDDIEVPARLGFPKQYRAAGDLQLKVYPTSDPNVLRLDGLQVDTVEYVIRMSDDTTYTDGFSRVFDSVMHQILIQCSKYVEHTGFKDLCTHIVRATTADQHPLSGRTWTQGLQDGHAYLWKAFSSHTELITLWSSNKYKYMQRNSFDWMEQIAPYGDPSQYTALARNFCYARSFLVTSAGRFGIGPSDSLQGDIVAIIPGGGVPYVLRSNGEDMTFVGESYISGIMNGESMETFGKGPAVLQCISLR